MKSLQTRPLRACLGLPTTQHSPRAVRRPWRSLLITLTVAGAALAGPGGEELDPSLLLTPKPGPEPRLGGPLVFGVRPGRPFLYRIPATGERPIAFAVEGLPEGIELDATTGILRGHAPKERGTRRMTLVARNPHGRSTRRFDLVVGDRIALTPPMGWNSWYIHYDRVTEEHMREAARTMVSSGMADFGYTYVNIDDCWMKKKGDEPYRDAEGRMLPNAKFPDIEGMVDEIHDLGLRAGLYTSPGPWTCAGYLGTHGHEEIDARTYAEWGFDFLKYDWCSYGQVATGEGRERLVVPYRRMGSILAGLDRDIVYNLCQYGMGEVWEWGGATGGHCWRTTGDLGLERGDRLPGFYHIGRSNARHAEHARPGEWNDPDYILIGRVGSAHRMGEGEPTKLTPHEQYSYMSMWCLMAAPLIFSGDMAALDELTISVLCNAEVIDIDQDPLGRQAWIVRDSEEELVLAKPLHDGSLAVGLFNLREEPAEMEVSLDELGLAGARAVRDLWRQKDLGRVSEAYSAAIPRHGVSLVRLSRVETRSAARAVGDGSGDGWRIDLSGTWRFALDPADQGIDQAWFDLVLPRDVRLPGSLQAQGRGLPVDLDTRWTGSIIDRSWYDSQRFAPYRSPENTKVPFWLQPTSHYLGAAWYQRDLDVPSSWSGRRVTLVLERCHWETRVWVDGREVGRGESLSAPNVIDLTDSLTAGPHRIALRVDNRLLVDVGRNAHSVSDHTQGNWNGVVGAIELRATPHVWIDGAQVYPDLSTGSVEVRLDIGNATGEAQVAVVLLDATAPTGFGPVHEPVESSHRVEVSAERRTRVSLRYSLASPAGDGVRTWSEFQPALYELRARLRTAAGGDESRHERVVRFGMREIGTEGTRFTLNGRPILLRGTLECCIFPDTGYPPTDVASWRRILEVCRAHGLNHLRFHSWCPPEAAFDAADELGFYYQVECAAWARVGAETPVDDWLYREADRILEAYGNHPSFVLLAYGNEPSGPERGARYLRPWVTHYREKDPRRLYTSGAGWPIIDESQFHVTPTPRIHQWGAGNRSRINAQPPETETDYRDFVARFDVPVVSHEIGQWCVYPDFDEIADYTGWLRPRNFEVFRDLLVANHMGDQARDFLMASGKLQVLCYKEEIESALRTPGFGGFQLLDLHDFPGQGTALVGVLSPFWRSKPYVDGATYRRFAGHTVPLARLPKRIFTVGDRLTAQLEISAFGPADLPEAVVAWRVERPGPDGVLASGRLPQQRIATGHLHELGELDVDLSSAPAPSRLRLVVGVEKTDIENDWDIWVYPRAVDHAVPASILETRTLDDRALERLRGGGSVLLLVPPSNVAGGVVTGFSSVFWNTAWTRNQPPHTLGLLCDPEHPALARFPTRSHTDWQWWDIVHDAGAMVIDELPPELRPIVQLIDTWFEARRLALAFEARVGGGKLLVVSADLTSRLEERPVARQLRHSLLAYMRSETFAPSVEVSVDAIRALVREPSAMERLGATVRADSSASDHPAIHVLDGDPETIWHTPWGDALTSHPHWIEIDLGRPMTVTGLRYVPRQDMSNGRIARWQVLLAGEGGGSGAPVATGDWSDGRSVQTVRFPARHGVRRVRLVALSEVTGQAFSSAAEIEVLVDEH